LKSIILITQKASFLWNSNFKTSLTKKSFFVIQNIIFILDEPKYVLHLHQIIETHNKKIFYQMKKWVPDKQNLNPSSEETQTIQCLITVFILATLFISSLGSKGLCYGYLKD